ncbi:hypothetical protein [Pseudonocardia sp. 73-21]|uniref:hypothetical protein n=1 Tax=Pseudonocardia sp. 73-21 TaxID=1895809 RepID=UPI000B0AB928|nr:hypothetical protein [Pseudonocardia sp. 73-21]
MSAVVRERGLWRCVFEVESFAGDVAPGDTPLDRCEFENLLMYGGMSCIFQSLIGNGSGAAGGALTYFNNANAAIGAGDSTTAAAATQTDLQAATNKLRKGMDATYPLHTDGVTSASNVITFRSTFGTAEANFDWQEVGIFNSATAATGRMLNRKTQAIGVKTSSISRVITATITLA